MARIVRKYGGKSLRDAESLRSVARSLADLSWSGDELVVVVSAMASTTDELLALAEKLNPNPPRREMDMLLSVGERISCSLLAMAIEAEGVGAISLTGSQVGIITDTRHGEARIVDIRPDRVLEALRQHLVVVVAGYQGVSVEKEITTLGRGGSDATAVALAAAIRADRCELMKDVDGLYSADPNAVENAVCVEAVDYESALRLAESGIEAIQTEAADLAGRLKVPLALGNSRTGHLGTIVTEKPFDQGEIVGIVRQDGILRKLGCEKDEHGDGKGRMFELHGRWVAWLEGTADEQAPFSGLTIVTAGRHLPHLHQAVTSVLGEHQIESYGHYQQPREYWICVKTSKAGAALEHLHDEFLSRGWIRQKA